MTRVTIGDPDPNNTTQSTPPTRKLLLEKWSWEQFYVFLCGFVAIVGIALVLLGLVQNDRSSKMETNITERERLSQCDAITDEALRVFCINKNN